MHPSHRTIRVAVLVMGKKGLEPLTLRLSGAYSCLLSYLPLDGHGHHYHELGNLAKPLLMHSLMMLIKDQVKASLKMH